MDERETIVVRIENHGPPAWSSSEVGAFILLSLLLPIVGVIVGLVNLRHSERTMQAIAVFMSAMFFWIFWTIVMLL